MSSRNEFLLSRLAWPKDKVDAVIDTDAFNEIDDQFAIAYMLRSSDRIETKALYAAPFLNDKSVSPEDGMEKSHAEIMKILSLTGCDSMQGSVYTGSRSFLADEKTPVISPAAKDLVKRAMSRPDDSPLYVIAIGAITNIASAILLEPRIIDKIVIIWLGGHLPGSGVAEFNLMQDVAAGRVIFSSGAPLIQIPCFGVASHLTTTEPELSRWLCGKTKLADYLAKNTIDEAESYAKGKPWSRVIWDISAVAWLIDDNFIQTRVVPSVLPTYDHMYSDNPDGHFFRRAYFLHRDRIFEDLFNKLN